MSLCHTCARILTVSSGGLHLVGLNWKEALQLVVRGMSSVIRSGSVAESGKWSSALVGNDFHVPPFFRD